MGHRGQIAHCTSLLAVAAFCRQDYEPAARMAAEGQRLGREINIKLDVNNRTHAIGRAREPRLLPA